MENEEFYKFCWGFFVCFYLGVCLVCFSSKSITNHGPE